MASTCGVVTITAPVIGAACAIVRCTSPVPGGKSIIYIQQVNMYLLCMSMCQVHACYCYQVVQFPPIRPHKQLCDDSRHHWSPQHSWSLATLNAQEHMLAIRLVVKCRTTAPATPALGLTCPKDRNLTCPHTSGRTCLGLLGDVFTTGLSGVTMKGKLSSK